MIEQISVGIAFIGTLISMVTDIQKGIIPDELSHAMIALGAVLLAINYGWESLTFFGIAIAIFVLGFIAYTFGQLGGGDVKLFTALALLIPTFPKFLVKYLPVEPVIAPYPFVISVFFIATILSVFFVSLNYLNKLIRDRKKIKKFKQKTLKGLVYCAVLTPMFYIWYVINPKMLLLVVPMCIGAFLLSFKNDILEQYIVIKKKVKDLNEEDVIATEVMKKTVVKKLGIGSRKTFLRIELGELKEKAKKAGIKEVFVSEYLPIFCPFIFVSLILNLVFGDVFLWMLIYL